MPCLKIMNNDASGGFIHQFENLKRKICNYIANIYFSHNKLC
jgi:hypothetical protein